MSLARMRSNAVLNIGSVKLDKQCRYFLPLRSLLVSSSRERCWMLLGVSIHDLEIAGHVYPYSEGRSR